MCVSTLHPHQTKVYATRTARNPKHATEDFGLLDAVFYSYQCFHKHADVRIPKHSTRAHLPCVSVYSISASHYDTPIPAMDAKRTCVNFLLLQKARKLGGSGGPLPATECVLRVSQIVEPLEKGLEFLELGVGDGSLLEQPAGICEVEPVIISDHSVAHVFGVDDNVRVDVDYFRAAEEALGGDVVDHDGGAGGTLDKGDAELGHLVFEHDAEIAGLVIIFRDVFIVASHNAKSLGLGANFAVAAARHEHRRRGYA